MVTTQRPESGILPPVVPYKSFSSKNLITVAEPPTHSGTKLQKSAKNQTKKIVKLIIHTNAYNSLTNYEYRVTKMTGNSNTIYVKMLKFAWKISEIASSEFIFDGF